MRAGFFRAPFAIPYPHTLPTFEPPTPRQLQRAPNLKPVEQLNSSGCAVACAAAVVGLPFTALAEQVRRDLKRGHDLSLSLDELARLIRPHGFSCCVQSGLRLNELTRGPAILMFRWPYSVWNGDEKWHCVCYDPEAPELGFMDPAADEPDPFFDVRAANFREPNDPLITDLWRRSGSHTLVCRRNKSSAPAR